MLKLILAIAKVLHGQEELSMPYEDLRKGRYSSEGYIYFITTVTLERVPYFRELFLARAVVLEMKRLNDESLLNSLAWVLMPDHLHWLFELGIKADLPGVIKRFKARSAYSINAILQRQGSVWQNGYHDRAIRRDEDLRQIARYIVANPLRKGLVEKIGDYPLWDAVWL